MSATLYGSNEYSRKRHTCLPATFPVDSQAPHVRMGANTRILSQAAPSLSRSHYLILFPFWHYDYGHDVLVDLFPGVPVPLSPGCQLREGEEIQLFVLQPPPPPSPRTDLSRQCELRTHALQFDLCPLFLLHSRPDSLLPPPHSWAPCCQAGGRRTHRE